MGIGVGYAGYKILSTAVLHVSVKTQIIKTRVKKMHLKMMFKRSSVCNVPNVRR